MDIKNLLCDDQSMSYYTSNSISTSSCSTISSISPNPYSPMSNYRRGKRTEHQTRTPWTSSEDYLLEQGYLQGLSWAMISSKYLPHRSRGCCWGRYKTLRSKSSSKRTWSGTEDRMLLGAIRKHTRLFKQAWRSVVYDLDNRNWNECELQSPYAPGVNY
ncbi:hypothetical protein BDB01DRAFT_769460 [Pilobolus umbonatus]|nr:hypothetical protein BDB01DRAFT_769460 [Pilobolus umbonatus]